MLVAMLGGELVRFTAFYSLLHFPDSNLVMLCRYEDVPIVCLTQ